VTGAPDERTTPVARRAASDADVGEDAEATVVSTRGASEGVTATELSEPEDAAAPGPLKRS